MILIDGKEVPDSRLDPAKHRFIGTFRFPFTHYLKDGFLPVGYSLIPPENPRAKELWITGYFDIPQYVTIGDEK